MCDVIIRNIRSGLVLDVINHNVVMNHFNGHHSQKWHLHHHGKGQFIIRNAHHNGNIRSGLVLDVINDSVVMNHFYGHHSQKWHLHHHGKGQFIIRNAHHNGKCLDVAGSKRGGEVILYGEHGGNNQRWYINSDKTIGSALDDDLVLDIQAEKLCPEQPLCAYRKHGKDNQKFRVE